MAVYKDDAEDEHLWKRTIIKQGEQVTSEYRINNRVVTASQYNEALEAENILIKARNFLVFQGDVEAIASQSPKDLTKLVEQISGSLEYKVEYERLKHAHEEALDNQTYTFNRRRGINSEVKQYQEQKREADNYAQKADEKDEAIVRHILWKLYHFQRVMDDSGEQMRKHQEELKEYRRGVEKYEKGLEEAKKEQARVGRDVSKVEREIKRKEKEIDEKENSLVPIQEKIQISGKKVETVNTRIEVLAKERDSHSQTVKQLSKKLKVVGKAQAQWEGESNKLAQQQGRELSEADLQQYNKLKEEVNKQTSANQIKVDHLTRQHKTDEETVNSLESKVKATEWQVGELEGDLKKINERKQATENRIQQTSKEIEQKKKELNNVTSERLRVAGVRTELDEKLQEVLSKLVEAESGRKQNEKELRMKEIVATLKRTYPGVKGRLSELCKPKQKKYAEAVSTVLGRHFDAVVVDNEKTAKDCIQHLRDQRSGQATFIPLDTIQVKAVNSNLKGMHRGMRLAIDTIEYDNAFERALLYACGNAIVCDDLATAKYICYERGVEAKAVTLDGTVIHKGGLMTGGRGPGQQTARRWEDAEVENLRKLKDNLLAEFEKLPKGHQKNIEEETLQGELTGLEQRLACDKEEAKALERNIESKLKALDFARRQLNEVQPKYEEKARDLQAVKENLEGFQDAVAEVEDDIFAEFCQRLGYNNIRTYEAQQGALQREGAQKKLEFQKQKSTLESQIKLEQSWLQDKKERIAVLETQANQHQSLITELEAQKESIQDKLDNLNAELDQLKEQLVQQKAKYAKKAEKVAEQRHAVQKRNKNVEGTVKAVNGLEAEIQRNAADKYALLRRCKLEDIRIPLEEDSADLDQLPIDDLLQADPDTMDIDEDPDSSNIRLPVVQDYGIEVDFDTLDDDLKEVRIAMVDSRGDSANMLLQNSDEKLEDELLEKINTLNAELDKMAPNMHAIERLPEVEGRLETTNREFEEARKRAKQAKEDFQKVRQQRYGLFEKAFSYISDRIDQVYKELTRSTNMPVGGQAYVITSPIRLTSQLMFHVSDIWTWRTMRSHTSRASNTTLCRQPNAFATWSICPEVRRQWRR